MQDITSQSQSSPQSQPESQTEPQPGRGAEEILLSHIDTPCREAILEENQWDYILKAMEEYASQYHTQSEGKDMYPKSMDDLYSYLQYYMEYCINQGYVTPKEWIEKHKHF